MSSPLSGRAAELRSLVWRFLSERLDSKLEKLPADDPKRSELQQQFVPATWLDDAARRVSQIQAVTHSLKPIHPDAKGSSLFREPSSLPALAEVGSHSLGAQFDTDVVGNAAALDVYKFLKLSLNGKSLLDLACTRDTDLTQALSDDGAQAARWLDAFASLADARGKPSSHTQAKQVYWPTGNDPHDDQQFHLLAPLYPTSLAHRVYQLLQDDRFSDEAKAARAARKAGEHHSRPVREYSNLAIQKLGGTKPQNISQLNSERRGDNALLASLPPVWKASEFKPILQSTSLFKAFGQRKAVWQQARALRLFLAADPAPTLDTRRQRAEWVDNLIDELIQFTAGMHTLPTGWTQADDCQLPLAHRQWLDPEATAPGADDPGEQVAEDFANWLNNQLRPPLPVGDAEFLVWRKLAREAVKAFDREAA
jgi:CRISPR-associated protein Csy1